MHATMRSNGPAEPRSGIRGVFYPSDDRAEARSFVPKVIAVLVMLTVGGEWMLLRMRDFTMLALEAIATMGPGA